MLCTFNLFPVFTGYERCIADLFEDEQLNLQFQQNWKLSEITVSQPVSKSVRNSSKFYIRSVELACLL